MRNLYGIFFAADDTAHHQVKPVDTINLLLTVEVIAA